MKRISCQKQKWLLQIYWLSILDMIAFRKLEDNWVSDSPYLHVFDGLEQIHHQMEEQILERVMLEIDYHAIRTLEHMLPNGKKLVQIDFEEVKTWLEE